MTCINAFLYSLFRMSLKPTPSNLAGTLSVVTTITMATALLRLPTPNSPTDDEWEWIDQTLAGYSKPDYGVGWIFVAGHYPGMNNVQCHGHEWKGLRPCYASIIIICTVLIASMYSNYE